LHGFSFVLMFRFCIARGTGRNGRMIPSQRRRK
jgi:hypothetical protein